MVRYCKTFGAHDRGNIVSLTSEESPSDIPICKYYSVHTNLGLGDRYKRIVLTKSSNNTDVFY